LKRRYELDGAARTVAHLAEALEKEQLRADDFSLRDLAEALVPSGSEWVRSLDPRSAAGVRLLENADGVDVTAFLNVASQVVYSKILESYRHDAFVASKLVDTIPTRLDGEKIPGISRPEDAAAPIHPGMPYPNVGFGEDYIETPSTTKYGLIIPVTREAIFFDRTHLVLSRAAEVGEILGLNKEKRILDMIVGTTNPYKWRGATYNTYQAATPWINVKTGNELIDWTDADAAEQMFAEMIDPGTNEPVLIKANTVLVMPSYRQAAHRVFSAPQISYTSASATETTVANPFSNYKVHESALAYRRILNAGINASDAKKWWFIGDFKRAFAYMENWPITVTQSAANSEADFNNDIVVRFKASERGAAAVMNPRYVVKNTG
jgi:hypothetical protein